MGNGGGGNLTKEEKALRFIDSIPSGKKFKSQGVAKFADLGGACHATKLINWSKRKDVKSVGNGEWLKL